MERKISIADLKTAVDEAYEKYKDLSEGTVDPRSGEADVADFGISVVLTDGTVISRGTVDTPSPLGSISKVPTAVLLMTQTTPEAMMERMGGCCCKKSCGSKPKLPVSAKGVRMVSAIQPQGDPDGKWDLISNNMIQMAGSSPVLDDKLYKSIIDACKQADAENVMAQDGWFLFDDAPIAIDQYAKLMSMCATATQLATMTATIAADGINPVTKESAFDGSISQKVTGMMAAKGPHKMAKLWLVMTGLPAVSSFGGAIAGVMPGAFGIAAYSPLVNEKGVSIRAAKALAYIMNKLQISALASARVTFTA